MMIPKSDIYLALEKLMEACGFSPLSRSDAEIFMGLLCCACVSASADAKAAEGAPFDPVQALTESFEWELLEAEPPKEKISGWIQ